ncbi:MarR family winged helix-turn-helix transcriptional regulator [Candidatus Blastococcus massiliensis]|uniref:MarR family winged helix-turn-helix transcriptional regulator n=1 Tax=Candidatus Blastococcus massiliensis TaxID=1470358 RepID=UPI0004BA1A53|nr:MarR family transcriptional regulator [Candidatus Blastococcus massiliensis]
MQSADDFLHLLIARTARELSRAFDRSLAAAGGSLPTWRVLLALDGAEHRTQAELATAVGIRQPTLTHHLDGLERDGLVVRERDPSNRRAVQVSVTESGRQLFLRLRRIAAAFDGRLRAGLADDEVARLRGVLAQLEENAGPD